MARAKILLAGESWMSATTHIKGYDLFPAASYATGCGPFLAALANEPFDIQHMPSHIAASDFPATLDALRAYDAVMLSDIGANTLLLHPDVALHSRPFPNRLKLLRDYVAGGGGLAMIGGYYRFQGWQGGARYRGTAVESVLPVTIHPYDDRIEVPEGFSATVSAPSHPLLHGVPADWPVMLGLNEVIAKPDATVLAHAPDEDGAHPLLVVGRHGAGRTLAWTTDMGPHWLPQAAIDWAGFVPLWRNLLGWLAKKG